MFQFQLVFIWALVLLRKTCSTGLFGFPKLTVWKGLCWEGGLGIPRVKLISLLRLVSWPCIWLSLWVWVSALGWFTFGVQCVAVPGVWPVGSCEGSFVRFFGSVRAQLWDVVDSVACISVHVSDVTCGETLWLICSIMISKRRCSGFLISVLTCSFKGDVCDVSWEWTISW